MNVNGLLDFREELVKRHAEELAAVDRVVALMSAGMASAQLPLEVAVTMDRVEKLKRGKPGRPSGLTHEAAMKEQAKARTTNGPPKLSGKERMRGGTGKLSDAIREACRKLPAGFSREQVSEGLPQQWQDTNGKSATCVNLVDMVARGELSRIGHGSAARYTVVRLKETRAAHGHGLPAKAGTPSEKEKAYRELRGEIRVPRELDDAEPS